MRSQNRALCDKGGVAPLKNLSGHPFKVPAPPNLLKSSITRDTPLILTYHPPAYPYRSIGSTVYTIMARPKKIDEKPKDSGSLQISVEDFVRTRNSVSILHFVFHVSSARLDSVNNNNTASARVCLTSQLTPPTYQHRNESIPTFHVA